MRLPSPTWAISTGLLAASCTPPAGISPAEWGRLSELRWEEPRRDIPPANAYGNDVWNDLKARELGRLLYFDTDLSSNRTVSCDQCHHAATSGADPNGLASSFGASGPSARNAPTVYNAGLRRSYSWFADEPLLWRQIERPLFGGFHDLRPHSVKRVVCGGYGVLYSEVFDEGCFEATAEDVGTNTLKVLGAYIRTLESKNSAFDRFMGASPETQDPTAMPDDAIRGALLFVTKAACNECHHGPTLSDSKPHFLGIGVGEPQTTESGELKGYQTPVLRQISKTGPYMHDGSFPLLWDVLEFYRDGGDNRFVGERDPELAPLDLTADDMLDLEAFLGQLDGAPLPYCWVNLDDECCTLAGTEIEPSPEGCATRTAESVR